MLPVLAFCNKAALRYLLEIVLEVVAVEEALAVVAAQGDLLAGFFDVEEGGDGLFAGDAARIGADEDVVD